MKQLNNQDTTVFSDLTDFDLFLIGEVANVTDNINTILLKTAFIDAYKEGHLQKYCSLIGCNASEIVSSLTKPALIFHFMLRQVIQSLYLSHFMKLRSHIFRMSLPYQNFGKLMSDLVNTGTVGNIGNEFIIQ